MTTADTDQVPRTVRLPVSILTSCRKKKGTFWEADEWDVLGVVAAKQATEQAAASSLVHETAAEKQYLWKGLYLELFQDAADGYYHNLMSDTPKAFVVCEHEEGQPIEPFLVTVSYDEGAAHMEVDEEVFSIPLPPELYRFVEHFVLEHYVPEQRKKRKRDNWKEQATQGHERKAGE